MASGKPIAMHAETTVTSVTMATGPPRATIGSFCRPAMIKGGPSSGTAGRQQLRLSTVSLIASNAAALDWPSVRPSLSLTGTPFWTSGQRVKPTLAAPADATATYGTCVPRGTRLRARAGAGGVCGGGGWVGQGGHGRSCRAS
eukprot:COSAG04_NODE_109_length_25931_cov_38.787279_20_plen_143_part_00